MSAAICTRVPNYVRFVTKAAWKGSQKLSLSAGYEPVRIYGLRHASAPDNWSRPSQ
jgi:hypothetical protein